MTLRGGEAIILEYGWKRTFLGYFHKKRKHVAERFGKIFEHVEFSISVLSSVAHVDQCWLFWRCRCWKHWWLDGSSGPVFEWWKLHLQSPLHDPWKRATRTRFGATFIQRIQRIQRPKTRFALRHFTAFIPSNLARARYCGSNCSFVVHFCTNRSVCCVVFYQRNCNTRWEICTGRVDMYRGCARWRFPPAPSPVPGKAHLQSRIQFKLGGRHVAKQSSKPNFWPSLQREHGRCHPAGQSPKPDFWSRVQPEHRGSDFAQETFKPGLWCRVQPKHGRGDVARQSSKLGFWLRLQSEHGRCDVTQHSSKADFWPAFQPKHGRSDIAQQP